MEQEPTLEELEKRARKEAAERLEILMANPGLREKHPELYDLALVRLKNTLARYDKAIV